MISQQLSKIQKNSQFIDELKAMHRVFFGKQNPTTTSHGHVEEEKFATDHQVLKSKELSVATN